MVQNYMETLVSKALKAELKDNAHKYMDVCQCPSCIAAIEVIALNRLKPFYVTTIAGEVYGEYQSKEAQSTSDVMVALGMGIEELKRKGPHSVYAPPNTSAE